MNRSVYSSPLPPDKIRLFQIENHCTNCELSFRVHTFEVDNCPPYLALSYAWEHDEDSTFKNCTEEVRVSKDLCYALHCIWKVTPTVWIWVDSICINQNDEDEKAVQVSIMGAIYKNAVCVVIWLGAVEDDNQLAIDCLAKLGRRLRQTRGNLFGTKTAEEIVQLGFPSPKHPLWPALYRLFQKKWFTRLWVVQEAALAAEVLVLCGENKVEWSDLVEVCYSMTSATWLGQIHGPISSDLRTRDGQPFSHRGVGLVRNIDVMRKGVECRGCGEECRIERLMKIMVCQSVSEPVDLVYAVRALLPQRIKDEIVVDYSEPTRKGYWSIHAKAFFLLVKELGDFPSWAFRPHETLNYPSWCPPLGCGTDNSVLSPTWAGAGRPSAETSEWTMTKDQKHAPSLQISLDNDGRTITMPGFCFDIIHDLLFDHNGSLHESNGRICNESHPTLNAILKSLLLLPSAAKQSASLPQILIGSLSWFYFHAPHIQLETFLADFTTYLSECQPSSIDTIPASRTSNSDSDVFVAYLAELQDKWNARNLIVTTKGHIALVPGQAEPGDHICIFLRARTPFVLRSTISDDDNVHATGTADHQNYNMLGPAFVDGIMKGELFDDEEHPITNQLFQIA